MIMYVCLWESNLGLFRMLVHETQRLRWVFNSKTGNNHIYNGYNKDNNHYYIVKYNGGCLILFSIYIQTADDDEQYSNQEL